MTAVLEISAAAKSFKRGAPVLRDVNLKVDAGEMVALIGASGSGKSTLIRLISGMEQMDRGAGTLKVLGELTQAGGERKKAQRALRSRIGVVFQQFNLVGRLSLLQNVLIGRLGRTGWARGTFGLFSRDDKVRAILVARLRSDARWRDELRTGEKQKHECEVPGDVDVRGRIRE